MHNMGESARMWSIFLIALSMAIAPSVDAQRAPDQWNSLISKGKEEGEVSLVTAWGPEPRAAVIRAFKERYNINVKVLSAGASQSGARILAERRANLFNIDAAVQGANFGVNIMKPAGAFDPAEQALILEEVKNPKVWFGDKFPWFDQERTMIPFFARLDTNLAINTTLVKPDEVKSYRDLLKPQWKGKIMLTDPTIVGVGIRLVSRERKATGNGVHARPREPSARDFERRAAVGRVAGTRQISGSNCGSRRISHPLHQGRRADQHCRSDRQSNARPLQRYRISDQ
jgi:spermidine/putrescine-binding protein